ncbi:putative mitochondrial protein [Trifolium repens]|nr:putative mitochondrial protein [Trifolium repens]
MLRAQKTNPSEKMTGKHCTIPWIIDTGASNHMTGSVMSMHDLHNIQSCPVGLPDGQHTTATKEGTVILDGGLKLTNVLYVPKLNCNLISVPQLIDESDCIFQFTNKLCVIQDRTSRMLIGAGERMNGLYFFRGIHGVKANKVNAIDQTDLWHRRLGHPSWKITQLIPSISKSKSSELFNKACDVCLRAKQTREKFPLSNHKASSVFELIHCDLWGPYRTPSSCGAFYFLTIVDDFSRAVWIYLLVDKKEVSRTLMNFFTMIERQYNKQVKIFRSDNGTEFTCMKNYFLDHGIIFQSSCIGTPQQNGRVERKHRHILNVARALRFQGHLPIEFWGECVLTAGYLINRTPSVVLGEKSPYEVLHGHAAPLEHLRVFGSLCYAHNQGRKGDKFASRSRKCVFVGYPYGKKGWRLYDLEAKVFFVSRDVEFFESEYPFANISATHEKSLHYKEVVQVNEENIDILDIVSNGEPSNSLEIGSDLAHEVREGRTDDNATDMALDPVVSDRDQQEADVTPNPIGESSSLQLGRGLRIKKASTRLDGYVTNTVQKLSPFTSSLSSVHPSGEPYPIAHYVNCEKFSLAHRVFLAAITHDREPVMYAEAVKDERWREAMQSEIQALENNETWTLTSLPQGKKALGCKWIYKIKRKSDGTVERYKARLVILGNHQVEGIDYTETFAPVVKMVTVRTVLAVAATRNWELHQMDVHNAFLHGELHEEVFMKLPPGFAVQQPGMVCKLKKSLYGLKQAPRCWFSKLSAALKAYGFKQSLYDYSLFVLQESELHLVVLVYVDDLIISGNNCNAIQKFKAYLHTCFHMKDLGVLKYFLGVEVARSSTGIFLCQRKYALDIVAETGLLGAKPANTPLEQNHHLALASGPLIVNSEQYRRLVGRLIYLCFTRPELSYCVHILSQFMQQPRQEHWEAALRVVRYLKGNPGQGILLRKDSDLKLYGWCDSDWASCPLTRRSLTGWFVSLGNSPISWKTKKQHTVSRSSAEAEYRSMANTTCELKWLKGILSCLGICHDQPIMIYCDSQAALHISKNPIFHERTKHIEVDCHFVRDEITKGIIQPVHVSTHTQLADIFTKALGRPQFVFLLDKLGICDLHAPT